MPETTTDTRTATPVLETVTNVILHCHRCNKPFLDYETEQPALWSGVNTIEECFSHPFSDVGGWRRAGDRYLCGDCHTLDEDGLPEENGPLPAADADKVTRAQLAYQQDAPDAVLDRLVGAAEDVLSEAEKAETDALFSGGAEPSCMRTAAMKALREAILALPAVEQQDEAVSL